MATLVLVRHATTAETGRRLTGRTPGVSLDDAGIAQAEATAARLAQLPVAAIYSSPLERTMETAEAIAAPHGLPVHARPGLGEVDFGQWAGQALATLQRRKAWHTVVHTPSRMVFPGGESLRAMQARVVEETECLAAEHRDEVIVCVSHADVIKAAVAHHLALPLDAFQRLVIAPASITIMELAADGFPLILRLNDTGPIASVQTKKARG